MRHRLIFLLFFATTLHLACGGDEKPPTPFCGDGNVDDGEACDDGNSEEFDSCRNDCTLPACGDGFLDNDEACDDGNSEDNDFCRADCSLPSCGDGVVDPLEECDLGAENAEEPDATCRTNCRAVRCGDGIADTSFGEVCDDGNLTRGDGCSPDCRSDESCGNGILDPGEQCDDGGKLSNDGCSSACVVELPQWMQFETEEPSLRDRFARVFDANRGQMLTMTTAGTYVLDGRGSRRATHETPLSGYDFVECVNDVGHKTVVCLTGNVENLRFVTKIWDGATWTTAPTEAATPARLTRSIAYDSARGRVVLFGGYTGGPTLANVPQAFYNDTWEWDGERWTQVETPTTPGGFLGELVYHPGLGKMVLTLGEAVEGSLSETWTYDGTDWTLVTDSTPGGNLIWSHTEGELLIQSQDASFVLRGNEWAPSSTPLIDLRSVYWNGIEYASLNPAVADAPPPNAYRSAAYSPIDGQILLTAGASGSFVIDNTLQPVTSAPTALLGTNGWTFGPAIPASVRPGIAYDARNNTLVLLGDDTHVWDGAEWRTYPTLISVDAFSSLAWSPQLQSLVRFAGKDGPFVYQEPGDPPPPAFLEEMFSWSGTTWMPVEPAQKPSGRWLANALWNPVRDAVTLVGGIGVNTTCCDALREIWHFDGTSWIEDTSLTANTRIWTATIYDPHRASVLDFGGYEGDIQQWYGQVLEQRGETDWEQLGAEGPALAFPAAAYHALLRRSFFFAEGQVWEFGFGPVLEVCHTGLDGDLDGLAGCADPDCWGYCAPECPPGAECPEDADRCGDGTCNEALETPRLCPSDCGAPTPLCGDFHCDAGEESSCPGDCP